MYISRQTGYNALIVVNTFNTVTTCYLCIVTQTLLGEYGLIEVKRNTLSVSLLYVVCKFVTMAIADNCY